MKDTVTVFTDQQVNDSALVREHGSFVYEPPVPLVEVDRFLPGDRIKWIAIPRDQSELGQISDDEDVGCGSHDPIMHYAWSIFKRSDRGGHFEQNIPKRKLVIELYEADRPACNARRSIQGWVRATA